MSFDTLDEFTKAYIVCALWSSNDESTPQGGEPMDRHYGPEHIAPETLQHMAEDCRTFQEQNEKLLHRAYEHVIGYTESSAGHDFWLTRNGHGAGFWDRGLGALGEELTGRCKLYANCDLYIGDDGKIYA